LKFFGIFDVGKAMIAKYCLAFGVCKIATNSFSVCSVKNNSFETVANTSNKPNLKVPDFQHVKIPFFREILWIKRGKANGYQQGTGQNHPNGGFRQGGCELTPI
jgi:hypothetical protein